MDLIVIIFSGLALLAAIVCLILLFREKKRNQKRNAALCELLRREFADLIGYIEEVYTVSSAEHKAMVDCLSEISKILSVVESDQKTIIQMVENVKERTEKLEKGIVPDYNEAVEAKTAVDNFSRDIAALLNFDPLEAAREARVRRRSAWEGGE